ncbi:MAG TPA: hypothetical protein VE860_27695 [Chthoniobacterales bacterium]|nr:hypothetical protein [Chthoniobacterales bacterium]
MSAFEIKNRWLQASETVIDELTATHAHLQIFVGNHNVTEYRAPRARVGKTALEIPTYYLAEWIAENWWALLFEPRKDEESDDSDYLTRHSIVAGQNGFPLPSLSIVPTGRGVHLNCSPRVAPYSNIRFTSDAFIDASRTEVEQVLRTFIDDTVNRLLICRVTETALARTWAELQSLTCEECRFCELIGSLGMSPVDVGDELSRAIERIYALLGPVATRDFCLAATEELAKRAIPDTEALNRHLREAPDAALAPLLEVQLPPDIYHAPSWRRGKLAAKNVQDKFGINTKNPRGADIIFEQLNIDISREIHTPTAGFTLPFSGAIDRHDRAAKIALLQPDLLHRRFGAGRAAYLAWVSEAQSRRLVTNAVTRDQQASRSFAAEILIPQGYLKTLAGPKGELHSDQVREAARLRMVMPDVAFKQAYNAGIRVHAI